VARGRHRAEPADRRPPRPLDRFPRRLARPAAGVGAALAVVGVVHAWPHPDPAPDDATVTAADQGRDGASAAEARRAVPARPAQRASRDMITRPKLAGAAQLVGGGRAGGITSSALSASKSTAKSASTATARRATTATATAAPTGVSDAPCSISPDIEAHLTADARAVYRAVCAAFGHTVSAFGGYRTGDSGDHGTGRAVDIMVSGEQGRAIARYVQDHARELGVTYVIYEQHIWLTGHSTSQWRLMEDRGSRTENHYDHVHVSVR